MPHSTNEVNIDLLQDISTDETSPSSSPPSPSSPPSNLSARSSFSSNANHPLPLTRENLAEHCRRFDSHESNQRDASEPGDDEEPCDLLAALRAFDVNNDLPSDLLDKMATGTKLESMTPMERFLAEENGRYEPPMDEDDKSMNGAHALTKLDEDQPDSERILMPAGDRIYEREGFGHRN